MERSTEMKGAAMEKFLWIAVLILASLILAQQFLLADAHRQARSAVAVAEQWKASSDAWRANSDGFEKSGKVCLETSRKLLDNNNELLANDDRLLAALIRLNNAVLGKRQ